MKKIKGFISKRLTAKILKISIVISIISILLFLLFNTSLPLKIMGCFLKFSSGIEVNAKGFKLRPVLKGNIDGLSILVSEKKFLNADAKVERIDFNGGISKGFKPRFASLNINNPKISIDVKQFSEKSSPYSVQDVIKRIPEIKHMEIKKGVVTLKFPGDTGVFTLKDIYLKVSDLNPATGGSITFKCNLYLTNDPNKSLPGMFELAINFRTLSPSIYGDGNMVLRLDGYEGMGILVNGVNLRTGVLIEANNFRFPELGINLKSIDFTNTSIPSLTNIDIVSNITFNLHDQLLNIKGLTVNLPHFGALSGEVEVKKQGGLVCSGSMHARDIMLSFIPEIISPFLDPKDRGWNIHGRGNLDTNLKGRNVKGIWSFNGNMIMDIKDGGFSSPDGTKAGEGIDISIELDINYPQREGNPSNNKNLPKGVNNHPSHPAHNAESAMNAQEVNEMKPSCQTMKDKNCLAINLNHMVPIRQREVPEDFQMKDSGQAQNEIMGFICKGGVQNGEFLWDTIYKNASGKAVTWDAEGFFLHNHRPLG